MTPPSPTPNSPRRERETIEREAAEWLARQDRGFSTAEEDAFNAWLMQDPRHGEAIAEVQLAWEAIGRAPASAAFSTVPAPTSDTRSRRLRPFRAGWLAVAAAGAAAAVLLAVRPHAPQPEPEQVARYETPIGGHKRVQLADGSEVELNTDTALETHFTSSARRVELLRGEAFFHVAKAPTRPFTVAAEGVTVRAVGTAFDVHPTARAVEVWLTEGQVALSRVGSEIPVDALPQMSAGHHAHIPLGASAAPEIAPAGADAIARALAWQQQQLVFQDASLLEIVAEFNRYSAHRLVIQDSDTAALRLSGTFRTDNAGAFVRLLEASYGIKAEPRDADTTVLAKAR